MGDDTGDFTRLRELFDRIAQLDPVLREAVIHSACGEDAGMERELRALLEAHDREAGRTGETRVQLLDEGAQVLSSAAEPGERVGPFVLREQLGRGGMGVVYRAERADGEVKQQVAVKILQRMHLDEAGVRRFQQERDIVAQLSHPGIARLFDAGNTRDGYPYYAMELVDGQPISTWCDERKLSIAERLALFLKVCDAVSFAHANLVLHRDIKPGNVLVDASGTPKLIDFGIAKTLTAFDATVTGLQLFSPSNAAPEQLRGERCGAACDVYQLATLLYELLTGRSVLGAAASVADVEAMVLLRVPTRPSEVVTDAGAARLLRGDLDTIVMRALRKEPEQRYASVEQFADDIRRSQRNEPIAARGGDRAYRLRKFLARNRVFLAATGAAVLVTLAFVLTLVAQAQRLERERDAARLERNRSQTISRFLTDVFTAADPSQTLDRNTSIGQVLDRGRDRLDKDLRDEPALRVPLLGVLANVYSILADADTATHLAAEGMQMLEANAGVINDREQVDFLVRVAKVRARAGDSPGAADAAARAVALQEKLHDPPRQQWEARREMVLNTITRQDRATWPTALHELVRYMESDPDIDPVLLADVRQIVGNNLTFVGVTDESLAMLRQSVATLEEKLPANHVSVSEARYSLGYALTQYGQPDEGIVLLEQALHGIGEVFGERSPRYARVLVRLAEGQQAGGHFDEAAETARRALAIAEETRKWPHGDYGVAQIELGEIYLEAGRWDLAEQYLREGLRTAEAVQGSNGANHVELRTGLSDALDHLGRHEEALALLDLSRPVIDYSTREHAEWAILRARILHELGRDAEAVVELDHAQPFLTADPKRAAAAERAAAVRAQLSGPVQQTALRKSGQ